MVKEFREYLTESNIDLILMPTTPIPSIIKDTGNAISPLCISYCRIFNGMDFPSGTIPITTIREDEQIYEDNYCHDKPYFEMKKNMENSKGLPIGLHVIGKPNNYEMV